MTNAQVIQFKSSPIAGSVVKISALPVVGNPLLQSQVDQMSVQTLDTLIDCQAPNLLLIDVRFKSEYDMAHVPGAILIPYPEIASGKAIAKIKQLVEEKRQACPHKEPLVVIMCKAGVRSARAVLLLKEAGIAATNITGGIQAWSQAIDSSVPQYSINDISEFKPMLANQRKMKKFGFGGGLAMASLAIFTLFTGNYSPNLQHIELHAGIQVQNH
jgi:rhodanese-related sulfurtransferase